MADKTGMNQGSRDKQDVHSPGGSQSPGDRGSLDRGNTGRGNQDVENQGLGDSRNRDRELDQESGGSRGTNRGGSESNR